MTLSDDLQGEMRGPWLDNDVADRLLAGLIAPDDAPPGYAQVARIVAAVTAPPSVRELAYQDEHVAAAALAVQRAPIALHATPTRSSIRSSYSRAKVVATLVAATVAGTTGLAMASALPAPAQDAISGVLAKVGISTPSSEDHPASTGEEISRIATTTDATGVDKGAEISGIASGGMSQAGQHGGGQDGADGDNSSGHGAGHRSSTGAEHSGGRSTEGSGNAPDSPGPPTP